MIAKAVLWFTGLNFAAFGLWALVAPAAFAKLIAFELTNVQAITEMRAFYGGLELGLGVFFILSAVRDELIKPGLLLGAVSLTCIASARVFGFIIDNSWSALLLGILGLELFGIIACYWALRRS